MRKRTTQRCQSTHFAALGDGVGLLVLVRAHAEVLDRLAGVALAAEEDRVGARRRAQRELVEREDLAARLEDALARGGGEAEGGDRELGYLEQAHVVRHRADGHDHLRVAVGRVGGLFDDAGEGEGRAVDFGEEEAVEDDLGSKCQYIRDSYTGVQR